MVPTTRTFGWACLVLGMPLIAWLFIVSGLPWAPQGDLGVQAVKIHDVFSPNPQLLGMPATTHMDVDGLYSNHPGSLYFQFVGVPFALSGYSNSGLLVGGLLVTAGLIATSLRAANAVAGRTAVLLTATYFALVELGLTGRLLTGWNPNVSSLALVASLLFAWATVEKRRRFLPAFIIASALAAQSHIAAVPVVLVLSGLVVFQLYRERLTLSSQNRGFWLIVAAALLLAWWAPVADALFRDTGNFQTLVSWAFARSGESVPDTTEPTFNLIRWSLVAILPLVAFVFWGQRKQEHWGSLFFMVSITTALIATMALVFPTRLPYLYFLSGTIVLPFLALGNRFAFLRHRNYVPVVAAGIFWGALLFAPPLPPAEAASSILAKQVSDAGLELLRANPDPRELPLVIDGVGGFAWPSLGSAMHSATISHGQPATLRNRVIDQDQVWRRPALDETPRRELLVREIGPDKQALPVPEGSILVASSEVWPSEQLLIDLGDVRDPTTSGFELVIIAYP